MFPLIKKYQYIFIVILILIISAVILLYRYNKPGSSSGSLSFKIADNSENAAAILLLTPAMGQFYIGDTVSIALVVNASDQSINVIEGKITFPSDKLELTSISKTDSIISLWAQEPVISLNQNGFIAFSGGIPSPGFIGTAGQIMSISFKVRKEGRRGNWHRERASARQ